MAAFGMRDARTLRLQWYRMYCTHMHRRKFFIPFFPFMAFLKALLPSYLPISTNHDFHLRLRIIQTLCLHLSHFIPLRKTLIAHHCLRIGYFQDSLLEISTLVGSSIYPYATHRDIKYGCKSSRPMPFLHQKWTFLNKQFSTLLI